MNFDNQGDAPNYYPNSFNGPVDDRKYKWSKFSCTGDVERHESGDDDNYSQVRVTAELGKVTVQETISLY